MYQSPVAKYSLVAPSDTLETKLEVHLFEECKYATVGAVRTNFGSCARLGVAHFNRNSRPLK